MNFNMNYPPNYQNFYHDTLKNLNDPNSNTPKILTDPAKNCTAEHSVIWIYNIFGQCILSNIEMIGFYFGLISIGCWMCSTIPQLVLNCRSGSADKALSFYFLFFWLAGDTCNMVGCILASQLPIQIITGCYYIIMDLIMIIQYLYLCKVSKSRTRSISNRARSRRDSSDSFLDMNENENVNAVGQNDTVPILMLFVPFVNLSSQKLRDLWTGNSLQDDLQDESLILSGDVLFKNKNAAIGYSLGIISCIFYMISRFPQITRNFRRGSTSGVSISMFILAICGNFLYGTSVLMSKHPDDSFAEYLKMHLPWLIGSYGTMALDVTIVCQCLYFGNERGYRAVGDGDDEDTILRETDE